MYKTNLLSIFLLLLFSCGGDEAMTEMETETSFAFEGKWLGVWSDSLFPSIPVSAEVFGSGTNAYSGSFYYNNNGTGPYTPCCGGTTDGTITFETKGDSVLNFVYIQNAPDYKGGCPGTYRGSGVINNSVNRLIINFSGEDCDGKHENGKMTWQLDK